MGIRERHSRDREAMRRRILDAARELFVTEGYQHVSIRRIASRIEYSPAAIYGYFPGKADIFFALAEEGFRRFTTMMGRLGAARDPIEALRRRFWCYYRFSKVQPEYFGLMFVDRSVPRISQEWHRFAFLRDIRPDAAAEIRRCIALGLLPSDTSVAAAFYVLATAVHGAALFRLSARFCRGREADALARDALEVAIAGLRTGVPLTCRPSGAHADAEPRVRARAARAERPSSPVRGRSHR